MADSKSKTSSDKAAAPGAAAPQPRTIGLGVRLVPASDSDQPRVANYTALTLAPGMAFIDFGFFEPAMLAALPRVAKVANLHQQLGSALQGLKTQART